MICGCDQDGKTASCHNCISGKHCQEERCVNDEPGYDETTTEEPGHDETTTEKPDIDKAIYIYIVLDRNL